MYLKCLFTLASVSTLLALSGCDAGGGYSDPNTENAQDADPVVQDFPIAYVQRPVPRNDEEDDPEMGVRLDEVLDPTAFNPGAQLIYRTRASASAAETVLTATAFAPEGYDPEVDGPILYDVKDISVSHDGLKLVFAMRAPEDPDLGEEEQPTWNIWEYDRETEILRRIISSDIVAESGHDVSPSYLPNGDIVFSSTRQRRSRAILLDEGKPQFSATVEADNEVEAFLLHVMDENAQEITQITFNQSHDLQPTVLSTGEILFLRWDNYNADRLSLYTVNPDGSNLTLKYGYHSQTTGTDGSEGVFNKATELPDGQILVNLRPRETDNLGGDIVQIDINNYTDNSQPTFENAGATDNAQASLTVGPVVTDDSGVSPHGHFSSAFPMLDGTDRLIVTWSPCLIDGITLGAYVNTDGVLVDDLGRFVDDRGNRLDEGRAPITPAPEDIRALPCTDGSLSRDDIAISDPQYGLWVYDPISETQSPVILSQTDIMYTDAVVIKTRPEPNFISGPEFNNDDATDQLLNENVGVLHIRSIYDFDGVDISESGIATMADPAQTAPMLRPAHFVRFFKAVSTPLDDLFEIDLGIADGIPGNSLKDILGYAPIHPDGSVMVKLPADVALSFTIVDADGRTVAEPLGSEHRNWLTMRAGEVRTCNGCHTAGSSEPHGRLNAETPSANPGAPGGIHFPNTVIVDRFDTPFAPPEAGLTMAEYFYQQKLAEVLGADAPGADGSALEPSMDLIFEDYWTDESTGLTKAPSYEYRYGVPDSEGGTQPGELMTRAPVDLTGCLTDWHGLCRATISYPEHIQPMWEVTRIVDVGGVNTDVTCINCHANRDADGNPQLPAPGELNQLNLLAIFENDDDDFPVSYTNLFRSSPILELCDNGQFIPQQELPPADSEFQFLQEPLLDSEGAQVFEQEQLAVDGFLQFQAFNPATPEIIVPAPLSVGSDPDATLELVMVDGSAVPFMVNVTADEAITISYMFQTACERLGLEPIAETIEVNIGDPIPLLTNRLDASMEPIRHMVPSGAQIDNMLSGNGARSSQAFFNVFAEGAAHDGYLNGAELKLISEWLDIGGQFYNNPFDTLEDD